MLWTCDVCDQPITGELHTVRLPRPSDPSDLCAIFATCEAHAAEVGAKPESYWDEYIESEEAMKAGHIFLT